MLSAQGVDIWCNNLVTTPDNHRGLHWNNIKIKIIQHVSEAPATVKLLEFSSHIREPRHASRQYAGNYHATITVKAPLHSHSLFVSGTEFY